MVRVETAPSPRPLPSIRGRLIGLVLVCLVPMLLFAAGVTVQLSRNERIAVERHVANAARSLAASVEQLLARDEALLRGLATSPSLARGDDAAFHVQAQAATAGAGTWIVLFDADGRQRLNTGLPFGAALPTQPDEASIAHVVATGRPLVSELFPSAITQEHVFSVSLAVRSDGAITHILALRRRAAELSELIEADGLPESWVAGIVDQGGAIVARSPRGRDSMDMSGRMAPADFLAAATRTDFGTVEFNNLEGVQLFAAFQRLPSGWLVGTGVPLSVLLGPLNRMLLWMAGAALLVLLSAGYLASRITKEVAGPIRGLSNAALAMGRGEAPALPGMKLLEAETVGLALREAAQNLERRQAERDLLVDSLSAGERRLRTIADGVAAGIVHIDRDLRFGFINATYAQWIGKAAEEIVGRKLEEVNGERQNATAQRQIRRALAGEQVAFENVIEAPGRAARTIEVNMVPERDHQGAVVGAFALSVDITERKAAELALKTSEERLRRRTSELETILETVPVAIWVAHGMDAEVITGNRWSAELMRLPPEANQSMSAPPERRPTGLRILVNGTEVPAEQLPVQRAARGEEVRNEETKVVFEDGVVVSCLVSASPVRNSEGEPVGAVAAAIDITERKVMEERQSLLMAELDHRVKNMLAVVQSIATQSLPVGAATQAFFGRLRALANTHFLLAQSRWAGADLKSLIEEELAAYQSQGGLRIDGPSVQLEPRAAQALALAIHELATNAAKYGVLSVPEGRVSVTWSVRQNGKPILCLEWREQGGPKVEPPRSKGFGSNLLERGLAYELGGTTDLDFRAEGLRCTMELPLSASLATMDPVARTPR